MRKSLAKTGFVLFDTCRQALAKKLAPPLLPVVARRYLEFTKSLGFLNLMTHFRFLSICKDARACVRNSSAFRNVRIDYEYRIGLSLSIIRLQPKMRVQSIRIYLASLEMDIARALLSAFGQHLTAFHLQRMNMKFGVPEFIKAGALTHECSVMDLANPSTGPTDYTLCQNFLRENFGTFCDPSLAALCPNLKELTGNGWPLLNSKFLPASLLRMQVCLSSFSISRVERIVNTAPNLEIVRLSGGDRIVCPMVYTISSSTLQVVDLIGAVKGVTVQFTSQVNNLSELIQFPLTYGANVIPVTFDQNSGKMLRWRSGLDLCGFALWGSLNQDHSPTPYVISSRQDANVPKHCVVRHLDSHVYDFGLRWNSEPSSQIEALSLANGDESQTPSLYFNTPPLGEIQLQYIPANNV
jgi:hypothetical protein